MARRARIPGGGIPDILALDESGRVVVDVDRGQLAQCLEYAGWARLTNLDEVAALYASSISRRRWRPRSADLVSYDGWYAWRVPRFGGTKLEEPREQYVAQASQDPADAAGGVRAWLREGPSNRNTHSASRVSHPRLVAPAAS